MAKLKKILKRFFLITLIPVFLVILLTGGFSLYLIISSYNRWEEGRDKGLRKIADYHYALIEQTRERQLKYFNPYDPGGRKPPTKIVDRNGIVIGQYVPKQEEIIYIEDIDPKLEKTLILMEDRQFYKHGGVNYLRIVYLALKNIISMRVWGGGSTISQQLVKNHLTDFESEKNLLSTLRRKLFEYFATIDIEKRYSKKEILAMYVNTVYLGPGVYGFESAAGYYFGKSLRHLRLCEYAMLVGILPNPGYYSPVKNNSRMFRKVDLVLSQMKKHGFIDSSIQQEEIIYFKENYTPKLTPASSSSAWKMSKNIAPYFNECVRESLLLEYTREEIMDSLTIHTTLDISCYKTAEENIASTLHSLYIASSNKYEASFVAIEPSTGEVLAIIGGSGFIPVKNEFNRAKEAKRQIGSLVKPFIYVGAFEKGEFPLSTAEDKLYSYKSANGNWSPHNYTDEYKGVVTLQDALRKSINTVAVMVLSETVGLSYFRSYMKEILDDSVEIPNNLTVALGTVEMSALEVALAYSVFASYGKKPIPYYIKAIEKNSREITLPSSLSHKLPKEVKAFSDVSIYFLNKTLTKVFDEGGTGYYATKLTSLDKRIAGKSGTTSEHKDAWFVLYYPSLVAVMWFGADDNTPLPNRSAGGTLAAPALIKAVEPILDREDNEAFIFKKPSAVQTVNICKDSGLPANPTCTNYFEMDLSGADLSVKCPIHHVDDLGYTPDE